MGRGINDARDTERTISASFSSVTEQRQNYNSLESPGKMLRKHHNFRLGKEF